MKLKIGLMLTDVCWFADGWLHSESNYCYHIQNQSNSQNLELVDFSFLAKFDCGHCCLIVGLNLIAFRFGARKQIKSIFNNKQQQLSRNSNVINQMEFDPSIFKPASIAQMQQQFAHSSRFVGCLI